jgi:hypothetical protein
VQYGGFDPAYQWYVNGVLVPGATAKDFITNSLHNLDSVSCVVTTGSGSACEGIKGFNWMFVVVAPEAVSGIGVAETEFSVVPNPNNGTFLLRGNPGMEDYPLTLQVTDVVGRKVYSQTFEYSGSELNREIHLNPETPGGQYTVRIVGKTGIKTIPVTILNPKR